MALLLLIGLLLLLSGFTLALRSARREEAWCASGLLACPPVARNHRLQLEYRHRLLGKDERRFRKSARRYLLPFRFHLPEGEKINLSGIAIWRLLVFFISLIVIADSLPVDALRVAILYPFLPPTPMTHLPLDLLIGLQWLLVPGVFFFWFAETVGFVPQEAAMFPVAKQSLRFVCGALALCLGLFSLYQFYRLNEYGQCLLVPGCQVNPMTVVSIVAGFTLVLSLSGIISLCGVIYGLRALVALWFVWRTQRARRGKRRLKLQLLAIAEEHIVKDEERDLAELNVKEDERDVAEWEEKEEERDLAELNGKEDERDAAEQDGKYPLPVIGPPQFQKTVERVLTELREYVPHRFREALAFLPKAEYVERSEEYKFAGRADGLFTLDGTGHIPLGNGMYRKNEYADFLYIFLHELGHCIGRTSATAPYHSEEEADAYAFLVQQEIEKNKSGHPP